MVHLAALSYSDQLLESSATSPLAAIRIIMRMMIIVIMMTIMMNDDDDDDNDAQCHKMPNVNVNL